MFTLSRRREDETSRDHESLAHQFKGTEMIHEKKVRDLISLGKKPSVFALSIFVLVAAVLFLPLHTRSQTQLCFQFLFFLLLRQSVELRSSNNKHREGRDESTSKEIVKV